MKYEIPIFLFIIIFDCINSEPVTIGVISSIVFGIGMLYHKSISCMFNECCETDSKWLPMNMTRLEADIKQYLHGQHLVELAILRHLKLHIANPNPMKALVLSFNGMPGTGKNFVSKMIANSLFKKGMKSKFLYLYLSSVHFPIEKLVDEYKVTLQNRIIAAVKQCPRSVFIFDEVQDMPGSLLDAIKPFVDNHESIDGVDYRKSIFIMLSNSGGKHINSKLEEIVTSGRARESLTLKEMEDVMAKNIYTMKNDGLRASKLITHNLITAFVPFLPLERRHVRLCIRNQLRDQHIYEDDDIVDTVLEMLHFEQAGALELASQGCKRIEEKLQLARK